jgi:hypothetical protein
MSSNRSDLYCLVEDPDGQLRKDAVALLRTLS